MGTVCVNFLPFETTRMIARMRDRRGDHGETDAEIEEEHEGDHASDHGSDGLDPPSMTVKEWIDMLVKIVFEFITRQQ